MTHFVGRFVTLRAIERPDLVALARFHNDPDVGAGLDFSWPISLESQERFFDRVDQDERSKRLVVEVPDHGVIGYTGLWGIDWINRRASNGVVIGRPDLQGHGYGTDTLMTIARVAFEELGLHRLDAEISAFNEASLRLYVGRCGWREEGRRRENFYRRGRYWDSVQVGILAAEYQEHATRTAYWPASHVLARVK
jgi:RimJ/RimL family protein N-acetyltransferase